MRIAKEGQLAITHYKPLEVSKDYTMMEVFLDTGRRIRFVFIWLL